ncbi:plasmid mobilization protein [Xanthomonas phaseoli pv. phaseoli]|nr:plasmid mobilization protein [Xanthomonas phaseoli pv. phaseoli]
MEASGLTTKTRVLDGRMNGKEEVEWIRAMIAERINAHLAEAGIGKGVEHRPLTERLEAMRGNDIFVQGQENFEQLLSRYRQEGRLLSVPDGHTAQQAQCERYEQDMETPALQGARVNGLTGGVSVAEVNSGKGDEAQLAAQGDPHGPQDSR